MDHKWIKTKVATDAWTDERGTHVTYHRTCVVSFTDEHITLNDGGWQTYTTKDRINQASREYGLLYSVYQKDYEWYIVYNNATYKWGSANTVEIDRIAQTVTNCEKVA